MGTLEKELSPLGRDLALSDVRLAAVRVLAGRPITEAQRSAARLLGDFVVASLAMIEGDREELEVVGEAEFTRPQITSMLRGFSGDLVEGRLTGDIPLLRRLSELLTSLVKGDLSTPQAERLLQTLHEIMDYQPEIPEPPELSHLPER